jgi:hypothetical protein
MSENLAIALTGPTSQAQESLQRETELYPGREFERAVPFSDFVIWVPPSNIDPDYLTSDLAAAFTTNIDNPVFKLPTRQDERNGALPAAFAMYAPYYVGTGLTPEQIAKDVAMQAALYLKRLDAEHGYDGYVGRVLSVLRRGHVAHRGLQAIEDRNILLDVHDFMAIITNRLHHIAPLSLVAGKPYSAAEEYRAGTHDKVDPYVKTVVYQAAPGVYNKRFDLPEFIRSDPAQLVALGWDFFDTRTLRRAAEFAALAAEKVGEPLVRGSLSDHYIPAHMRRRQYMLAAS